MQSLVCPEIYQFGKELNANFRDSSIFPVSLLLVLGTIAFYTVKMVKSRNDLLPEITGGVINAGGCTGCTVTDNL